MYWILKYLAVAMASLSLGCVSARTGRSVLQEHCQAIVRQGVLNQETMSCFPAAAQAAKEALCATPPTLHRYLNNMGFGYGTQVFDQILTEYKPGMPDVPAFDAAAVHRWKEEQCLPAGQQTADPSSLWKNARAQLPKSLFDPWVNCLFSLQSVTMQREFLDLRCFLVGSYDMDGEDEEIAFEAVFQSFEYYDFSTRLKEDLHVEGADCFGEEWQKGTKIRTSQPRLIRCRRNGRSAVRFRLVTKEGQCQRELPELTEPPWRELCQGAD